VVKPLFYKDFFLPSPSDSVSIGKQQRRKTLGRVVKGNLDNMLNEASKVLAQARLGTDVVAEAMAAAKPVTTLGNLVPIYLKAREDDMREKSLIEVTRYLAGSTTKDKDGNVKELTPSVFNPLHNRQSWPLRTGTSRPS